MPPATRETPHTEEWRPQFERSCIPRASRCRLLLASPLTPTWISGLTLFACLFLPLCLIPGCQNAEPVALHPLETALEIVADGSPVDAAWLVWAYPFGLLAAIGAIGIALSRNPHGYRIAWWAQAFMVIAVSAAVWTSIGVEIGVEREYSSSQPQPETNSPGALEEADSEALLAALWLVVPTAVCCGLLVITYFNCRDWLAAVAVVQLGLAVTALAWFLAVRFGFGYTLLVGGKLSIAACAGLMVGAAWQWRAGLLPYRVASHERQSVSDGDVDQHRPSGRARHARGRLTVGAS